MDFFFSQSKEYNTYLTRPKIHISGWRKEELIAVLGERWKFQDKNLLFRFASNRCRRLLINGEFQLAIELNS